MTDPTSTTTTRGLFGLSSPGRTLMLGVVTALFASLALAAWWSGAIGAP